MPLAFKKPRIGNRRFDTTACGDRFRKTVETDYSTLAFNPYNVCVREKMNTRRNQLLEMLRESPTDSESLYFLAMESISEGIDSQADVELRKLLSIDPSYVAAYLQHGQVLVRLGREDEARNAYSLGIEIAKKAKNNHAHSELSSFLEALG